MCVLHQPPIEFCVMCRLEEDEQGEIGEFEGSQRKEEDIETE